MEEDRQRGDTIDATPHSHPAGTASALAPSLDSRIAEGAVLGQRFRILELIARGGTSCIYKARDLWAQSGPNRRAELAIKIPRDGPQYSFLGEDFSATITAYEAIVTRELTHPNILRIYDFHSDGPTCFITMEYLSGESLSERLLRTPKHRLPNKTAIPIITAIASGLATAHGKGIVHSDLKPSNVLLTDEGGVKVIDFANARQISREASRHGHTQQDSGYIGYSPAYASPETLSDLPATPSDDVYSLACLSYEMLSGRHPFDRLSSLEALHSGLRAGRPRGMSLLQWWVLRKGLQLHHSGRFQSIRCFAKALRLARRAPVYALLLLSLGLMAAVGGQIAHTQLSGSASGTRQQDEMERSRRLIDGIHETAPLDRPDRLRDLDSLSPLFRSAALASLQDEVTSGLLGQIKGSAGQPTSPTELNRARSAVARTAIFYPDSARLQEAQRLLNDQRQQDVDRRRDDWRRSWAQTQFSVRDGHRLRQQAEDLEALQTPISLLLEDVRLDRFTEALRETQSSFDFGRLAELTAFAEALPMLPALKSVTDQAIGDDRRRLAGFLKNYNRSAGRATPTGAADRFWSSYLGQLEQAATTLWWDQELAAAEERIEMLRRALPAGYPPLEKASQSLARTLLSKSRSYERLDQIQKADDMRKDAKRLIDKNPLPGETPERL